MSDFTEEEYQLVHDTQNYFWQAFSDLCNSTLAQLPEHLRDYAEPGLSEKTSWYGRNDDNTHLVHFRQLPGSWNIAVGALKDVKEACLFVHDDGQVGVSQEPYISGELFNRICKLIEDIE